MIETLLAVAGFAFVTFVTPGPNNVMLLASGANFGYWRSLPHILGIALGFPAMTLALALGFGSLFQRYPAIQDGLKLVALIYLFYLAWRIARAGRPDIAVGDARPLSFLGAAAFQWVNPKGWAIALSLVALYAPAPGEPVTRFLMVVLVLVVVSLPVASVWCLSGLGIARFLEDPGRARIFNIVMAVLLVLSTLPALL